MINYKQTKLIISFLQNRGVTWHKSKHNPNVFIGDFCPICRERSKKVLRYHQKLKVGKCYCCGFYWKTYHFLLQILPYRMIKAIKDKQETDRQLSKLKFEEQDDSLPF